MSHHRPAPFHLIRLICLTLAVGALSTLTIVTRTHQLAGTSPFSLAELMQLNPFQVTSVAACADNACYCGKVCNTAADWEAGWYQINSVQNGGNGVGYSGVTNDTPPSAITPPNANNTALVNAYTANKANYVQAVKDGIANGTLQQNLDQLAQTSGGQKPTTTNNTTTGTSTSNVVNRNPNTLIYIFGAGWVRPELAAKYYPNQNCQVEVASGMMCCGNSCEGKQVATIADWSNSTPTGDASRTSNCLANDVECIEAANKRPGPTHVTLQLVDANGQVSGIVALTKSGVAPGITANTLTVDDYLDYITDENNKSGNKTLDSMTTAELTSYLQSKQDNTIGETEIGSAILSNRDALAALYGDNAFIPSYYCNPQDTTGNSGVSCPEGMACINNNCEKAYGDARQNPNEFKCDNGARPICYSCANSTGGACPANRGSQVSSITEGTPSGPGQLAGSVGSCGVVQCDCPGTSGANLQFSSIVYTAGCGYSNVTAAATPIPTPGPTAPPAPPPEQPPSEPPSEPPVYGCNSTCENNAQCQSSNPNLVCDQAQGSRCRLASNPSSPTCQPAVGPQCLSLSLTNISQPTAPATQDPNLGDAVRFTCGQVSGAARYIFRVIEPNSNIVNLTATGNTSASYTINQTGRFYAQCQICTGAADSTCFPYATIGAVSPSPSPAPSPSPVPTPSPQPSPSPVVSPSPSPVASPSPSPAAGAIQPPTLANLCGNTQNNQVRVTWTAQATGLGSQGYWIVIDNDSNSANGYWRRRLASPTLQTIVTPIAFEAVNGAPAITNNGLQSNQQYRFLVGYGGTDFSTVVFGPAATITTGNCNPTASPTPSPSPSPSPAQLSAPTVSPSCNSGFPNLLVQWSRPASGLGSQGYWVVVDSDNDSANGFFRRRYSDPSETTSNAPGGFEAVNFSTPQSAVLASGQSYRVIVSYVDNGSETFGPTVNTTTSNCSGGTPQQ